MIAPVLFGALGLIVGSFLNVLIVRWGERSLGGRSACPSCARTLEWYELIPVLSWLALSGRCRTCRAPISVQYPLVEGATAAIYAAIALAPLTLYLQVMALPIAALFVAIFVYDLYHTIIPDLWAYAAAGLALFAALAVPDADVGAALLAGPLAALPLFALWLVSGGRWMGLGDSKLALAIGWILGTPTGVLSVFFAFVLGALVSVPLLFLAQAPGASDTPKGDAAKRVRRFTMKSEIPFGPFLIASCVSLWFMQMYGVDMPISLF